VAETIYDMIGIRIVVQNQADAIQVVRMLYKAHVISFPNTIPARSRNTMINLDSFRVQLDDLRGNLMTEVTSPESLEAALKTLEIPPPVDDKDNLHSGSEYHAIQLTCRQLIRTPRPLTVLRKNLEVAATEAQKKSEINTYFTEMAAVLKNIARLIGDEEFAFFPFEVQIMDKKAWETNSTGKASHGRYKRSQVRAARRRVLNEILPLS